MRIPKSFQLVNRTWKVKFVSDEEMAKLLREEEGETKERPPLGMCVASDATIYLNKDAHEGKPREWLEHTFCHELMHAICYVNGQHTSESHDEILVDRFGGFLHQFLQTQKGEHEV